MKVPFPLSLRRNELARARISPFGRKRTCAFNPYHSYAPLIGDFKKLFVPTRSDGMGIKMNFYMPTRIISGENCIEKNGDFISVFGKRALIVTGKTSAKQSGALSDVINTLENANVRYDIYCSVQNNPTVESCHEAGNYAKKSDSDFIMAIGGGSPLDAAKAISMFATNDINPMDIFNNAQRYKPLPVIAIPTTAGTGSEVTQYSVLTVNSLETKMSFSTPDTFPRVAFLDARYTESLNHYITVNTVVDALSHALESILNKRSSHMSELFAFKALELIGQCMGALLLGKVTKDIREKLLHSSTLAGIAIAHTGTSIVHSMGYNLTYYKNIPHGRANGLLLNAFINKCGEQYPHLIGKILNYLNIKDTKEFNLKIHSLIPDTDILNDSEAKSYAAKSIKAKNVATCIWDITEEDEYIIFSQLIN